MSQRQASNPAALAGLAHALVLQNRFAEARRAANASLGLKPNAEAYLVLARAYLHEDDVTGAQQNLQQALALEPANDDARKVGEEIQSRTSGAEPER